MWLFSLQIASVAVSDMRCYSLYRQPVWLCLICVVLFFVGSQCSRVCTDSQCHLCGEILCHLSASAVQGHTDTGQVHHLADLVGGHPDYFSRTDSTGHHTTQTHRAHHATDRLPPHMVKHLSGSILTVPHHRNVPPAIPTHVCDLLPDCQNTVEQQHTNGKQ